MPRFGGEPAASRQAPWLLRKAAVTIVSAILKLFSLKLSRPTPPALCDLSHTTVTVGSTSAPVTAPGYSPLSWGEFWGFLDTQRGACDLGDKLALYGRLQAGRETPRCLLECREAPQDSSGSAEPGGKGLLQKRGHSTCPRGRRRAGGVRLPTPAWSLRAGGVKDV